MKVFSVPENASNRFRKELDGFNAKIHGQAIENFPCYLIGQLSRNSNVSKNLLDGKYLVDSAYHIISTSTKAVGGRHMMVECHNDPKLIQFYIDNSFIPLSEVSIDNQPMVQMIRKIA